MGVFDKIRNAFQRPRVQDPVLGEVVRSSGQWEGRTTFAPVGRDVEFCLDAGDAGPTEGHRAFYRELLARYADLCRAWEPMLRASLQEFAGEPGMDACWEEFQLEGYEVGDATDPKCEWSITFTSETAAHYFTVNMIGWTPEGVVIDG